MRGAFLRPAALGFCAFPCGSEAVSCILGNIKETPAMNRRRVLNVILILPVVIFALGALAFHEAHAAGHPPAVGSEAPNFTLPSQTGTAVSLNDFRGKWVVLYFYPKDFSSGCTVEAHNFQRDFAQYEQKNAAIVGVSVDTADSHQKFCTKEGLNFKLLADTDRKVSEEYGSIMNFGVTKLSARHTFLINPEGVIVKEYLDVDPKTHSEQVLAELTDLQKNGAAK
jgi:thioredoxin-dependent peroxiredoxin